MSTTESTDLGVTLREIDRQEAVIAGLESELDRVRVFAIGAVLALAVVAAMVFGFYLGRTTAPKSEPQPPPVASATLGDLGGTSSAATKAAEKAMREALGGTKLKPPAGLSLEDELKIAAIAEEWGEHQRLVQQHPIEREHEARRPQTTPFPGGLSERTFDARCFAAGGDVLWTNPPRCTVDIPALTLPAIPR